MKKNGKDFMDITEFQEELGKFRYAFDRIKKFSNWMTTVALTSLGFALTFFFQIRSKAFLPNKYLAALVLSIFVISALLGFYNKFKYEMIQFINDLRIGGRGLFAMFGKATKEFSWDDEIAELTLVANERFKEMVNNIPGSRSKYMVWPIIGQVVTLSLGLTLFCVYIGIYLFKTN